MGPIVFVLALLLGSAKGDYPCLCSYQVEAAIHATPDESSTVDGYMYEFDCKPFYDLPGIDPKFAVIGNENKYGYIVKNTDIQIQTCQGNIPAIHLVKTTTAAIPITPTTTMSTTLLPTTKTTTPLPTTKTTTPQPTTPQPTKPTTPQPTTPTTQSTAPIVSTKTTGSHSTKPHTSQQTTPTTAKTTQQTITTTRRTTITTQAPTTTKTTTPRPTTRPPTTTTMLTTSTRRTTTAAMSSMGKCLVRLGHPDPTHVSTDGVYCYQFIDTKQSWMHAKQDCARRNGHLLSIDSQSKNDFTYKMLTKIPYVQPVWIGLNDRTSEEKWQWDSGIPATYFNWMPVRFIDQYHSTEDCGVFVHARQGQWDDMDCDGISYDIVLAFPYICQFRL
ncbi:brevican core protein-like [Mya arenaria]|uniref:brevican core protein-like n=1 Tax=Mya arenaria TaxID=6604 RepID=UPI0022E44D47|nr:brevican core protein-like [Mya arenaria]